MLKASLPCHVCVTVWISLAMVSLGLASTDDKPKDAETRFVEEWVLVRLSQPLVDPYPDGSYPLKTGRRAIDAAIERLEIHRIELALTSAARSPHDPAALARHGLDRIYKFHVPPGSDVLALVNQLADVPGVAHAEPDHIGQAFAGFSRDQRFPDDPRFEEQWGLHNTGQDPPGGSHDADIDAPAAWAQEVGADVLIAFIDTGVDTDHEELWQKLALENAWDFINDDDDPEDDNGHGTATSSLALADTDNGIGMAGVCWGCRLMPLKAFDEEARGAATDVADAIIWATDHGARLINVSAGFPLEDIYDALPRSVAYATDAGVLISASVGNSTWMPPSYPARYRETVASGGTDEHDQLLSYSARGREVDVVAPARETLTAWMGGGYDVWEGTSYAAPLVSGTAGLLHTLIPSMGLEQTRHLIRSGAEDEVGRPAEDTPGFDHYHGWGRLNLHRTVQGALSARSLRVTGNDATQLTLDTQNPLAESYDFVRGDLEHLEESVRGVQLGSLTCIEDDSSDADTTGHEDTDAPPPGRAFFYLARFNAAPGAGSYGGSTLHRDRVPMHEADWEVFGGQADAYYGYNTSSAGDVNADGYDDVIVGAFRYDGAEIDAGRAEVYLGGPTGLASTPVWSEEGDQEGAYFGWHVSAAGDVNGDGYDDIILSARERDGVYENEGRVYVYHGSAAGPEPLPAWTVDGPQESAHFGISVNGAGDVDGDGYDDVIFSANLYDETFTNVGKVWVYHGSATGLSDTPAWTIVGHQEDQRLGLRVDSAGDVNADGYSDVFVGSHRYDGPEAEEGCGWVFLGGPGGLEDTPNATLEIDVVGANFGASGGRVGDVNGDGYDDVAVGAAGYANGQDAEGGAFLYYGSASGVQTPHVWSFETDQEETYLGEGDSVDGVGDINGDGFDDLVLGAYAYDETRTDEGRVYVFYGSASGLSLVPDWVLSSRHSDARLGYSPTNAGDTNGDGIPDFLTDAHGHDENETDEGRVLVFYGPLPEDTDCPR